MNALDIDFDSWTHRSMSVVPRNSQQALYHVEVQTFSRTITFKDASGRVIGQTKFHTLSNTYDIGIFGQASMSVTKDKFWSLQRSWNSASFACHMRWKSDSSWSKIDYILLDQNEMPVAKFVSSHRWKKSGAIEFSPSVELNNAQVLEVIMSGISLAIQVQRQRSSTAGSSFGAAASC